MEAVSSFGLGEIVVVVGAVGLLLLFAVALGLALVAIYRSKEARR